MKKKEIPKKTVKKVNKLLIGMVIGGAVGSVVGATMTNKTGKENREILKKKSKAAFEKGKEFLEENKEEIKELKTTKGKSVWHFLNKLLIKKKDEE